MPDGRLLDTSVLIPLLRGEPGLRERLTASRNYLSTTILGELLLGAMLSSRAEENLERTQRFAASVTVLAAVEETARHYAEIGRLLETLGQRIPQNDQWIAAVARQHGLTLVHRDRHFAQIPGISQELWERAEER